MPGVPGADLLKFGAPICRCPSLMISGGAGGSLCVPSTRIRFSGSFILMAARCGRGWPESVPRRIDAKARRVGHADALAAAGPVDVLDRRRLGEGCELV